LKNSVLEVLLTTISKDENEFVRINSIRALSRFDTTATQKAMLKYLQDSKPHVAIVASEFVKTHARKDDKIDYFDLAEKARHPQVRANLLAAAIIYEHKQWISKDVKIYFRKTTNIYEKGFLLNSLANNPKNYEFIQQQIKLIKPNPLNTFAFEALNLVRNSPNFDKIDKENKFESRFKDAFEKLLIEIVNGNDAVLIGLAATELRSEKRNYKTTIPTVLAALKAAKEKLPLPLEIEAVIEIQKTIDFFEGKVSEVSPKIMFNNAIDWAFIETLPEKPQVQIKTSKGLIVIELFTNDAPASVANFLKLTKQGFYNDKVFHRVVQNFVVQTGCPRGDGYGNVPFSIRSEFANLNYGEGYFGMASAGKDTEVSQWFITHSPTPHLDVRYTIFGRVISGMDIVNKLEIGDKVLNIE
jgi:cyclophilin family peptidyl-prolyl cis-trans isomerase